MVLTKRFVSAIDSVIYYISSRYLRNPIPLDLDMRLDLEERYLNTILLIRSSNNPNEIRQAISEFGSFMKFTRKLGYGVKLMYDLKVDCEAGEREALLKK